MKSIKSVKSVRTLPSARTLFFAMLRIKAIKVILRSKKRANEMSRYIAQQKTSDPPAGGEPSLATDKERLCQD